MRLILGPGTVAAARRASSVDARQHGRGDARRPWSRRAEGADAVVMAAAVADFRPKDAAGRQAQEGSRDRPSSSLEPTPDILAELGSGAGGQILVGFAAETADVEAARPREAARASTLDLLVANEVGRDGTGFGADTNRAAIVTRTATTTRSADWTKRDLAEAIVDRIARARSRRRRR